MGEAGNCTRKPPSCSEKDLHHFNRAFRVVRNNSDSESRTRQWEDDIMYEIRHGPVVAVMEIYKDFFMYGSGVYQKSIDLPAPLGFHAVRLLGWGSVLTHFPLLKKSFPHLFTLFPGWKWALLVGFQHVG